MYTLLRNAVGQQAALARSAKWNTTEPPVRPMRSRQGVGPSSADAIAASSAAGLSLGKPPLSMDSMTSPRPSKLDALLQQQQQQQSSSSVEHRQALSSPGALGPRSSFGAPGDLQHAHSATGALGPIGPLVRSPCSSQASATISLSKRWCPAHHCECNIGLDAWHVGSPGVVSVGNIVVRSCDKDLQVVCRWLTAMLSGEGGRHFQRGHNDGHFKGSR
jgi:hypothetical protein